MSIRFFHIFSSIIIICPWKYSSIKQRSRLLWCQSTSFNLIGIICHSLKLSIASILNIVYILLYHILSLILHLRQTILISSLLKIPCHL